MGLDRLDRRPLYAAEEAMRESGETEMMYFSKPGLTDAKQPTVCWGSLTDGPIMGSAVDSKTR